MLAAPGRLIATLAVIACTLAGLAAGCGGNPLPETAAQSSFVDDFDGGGADPRWLAYGESYLRQGGGTVEISPPPAGGYSGYVTTASHNLVGGGAAVEISDPGDPTLPGFELYLTIKFDQENYVAWRLTGSDLFARSSVDGRQQDLIALPWATDKRWLRIREEAGTTYWQYSPDGSHWSTAFQSADPIAMGDVYLEFGAGRWQASAGTTTASFSTFAAELATPS
jgi:hypothetical protein